MVLLVGPRKNEVTKLPPAPFLFEQLLLAGGSGTYLNLTDLCCAVAWSNTCKQWPNLQCTVSTVAPPFSLTPGADGVFGQCAAKSNASKTRKTSTSGGSQNYARPELTTLDLCTPAPALPKFQEHRSLLAGGRKRVWRRLSRWPQKRLLNRMGFTATCAWPWSQ